MKIIFLNEKPENISRVYSKETTEKVDLDPKIYCKEDIIGNKRFADTEFIFSTWGMPQFTEQEIKENLPNLKGVFYAAGSVQYFARPFLNCGVKVFSAWAANALPVAEYVMSAILLSCKGFLPLCRKMSEGDGADARAHRTDFRGNFGENVGIIGAGMIGKRVIELLKPFKLNVMVYDAFLPDSQAEELGVTKCSLETLFENCYVISNHLADNEQTKGMLNYSLFAKMRKNATFINTGRGAQVVEEHLAKVLNERPDITALLDVTIEEPPRSEHPFYALKNCFLTPHIAGSNGDEVHRMAEYMIEEFFRVISNEPTKYEVTPKMLDTMA